MTRDSGAIGRPQFLADYKRLYDQAARVARFGAWECDLATEAITWTAGVYDLFEITPDRRLKRASIVDLYVDESREAMEQMRAEAIRGGQSLTLDAEIRTWRGKARWMRLSIGVAFEAGRAVRIFGAKQDITEDMQVWERLRRMAERDSLTGLANRTLFDARYAEMVGDTLNHGFVAALALVDLDHFKSVNDRRGHATGDECLRQTAMRLRHVFGDAILVARIGGDEFAVLLRAPMGQARIRQLLRRAADVLREPVFWNGRRVDIGASIGATILGRPHRRKASALFAEADSALYAAKAAGRQSVHVFGDDTQSTTDPSSRREVA